jgi:hypothetical protein
MRELSTLPRAGPVPHQGEHSTLAMLPKMWKMNAREYYISRQAAAIDPRRARAGGGHKREREAGKPTGESISIPRARHGEGRA